jgi:F-type H+-transporting ATPase subunit delta
VYAKSLFELAEAAGGRAKIEEVADELEQIIEIMRGDAEFAALLASPIVDHEKRAASIRRIFDGRITDLLLRFLMVLNRKNRLGHLEPIAEAYDHLVQESFGRVEVDVFTAGPLGPEAMETIRRRVKETLGREPVLHPYTDPDMIAGIKLRIGDRLIDGSVETQLRRMRSNLLTHGSVELRERIDRLIDEGAP